MDAKEAIELITSCATLSYEEWLEIRKMSIEALEKVPVLEAENARLRRLVFDRCPMHINTPYSPDDLNCMYVDGKCEGYQRNKYDDEPPDFCKECIINQYYEE